MRLRIEVDGERFDVDVQRVGTGLRVECEDARLELESEAAGSRVHLRAKEGEWSVDLANDHQASIGGKPIRYFVDGFSPGTPVAGNGAQARQPVRAAMHGRLVKVLAQPGQAVTKGEPLFILEAMKMQNELASPADGTVAEVVAKPGDVVDVGRVLAWLERRKA